MGDHADDAFVSGLYEEAPRSTIEILIAENKSLHARVAELEAMLKPLNEAYTALDKDLNDTHKKLIDTTSRLRVMTDNFDNCEACLMMEKTSHAATQAQRDKLRDGLQTIINITMCDDGYGRDDYYNIAVAALEECK